jgi:hypothetical protein
MGYLKNSFWKALTRDYLLMRDYLMISRQAQGGKRLTGNSLVHTPVSWSFSRRAVTFRIPERCGVDREALSRLPFLTNSESEVYST